MPISTRFNERFLEAAQNHFASPDSVHWKAVEYALKSPGKRLRPTFVEEVSQQIHLPRLVVEPLSYAIELVHLFSLIHDDLPCMDNDDFRRGLPTTHKVFGEAQALLAGDTMLSLAYEIFSSIADCTSKEHFISGFRFFSSCIGAQGMIGGQSLELESPMSTEVQILEIQGMKTGALFQASILCPLLLAGKETRDPIYKEHLKFAEAFGFAFQIADDLEDHSQDQRSGQLSKNILSIHGAAAAKKVALDQLNSSSLSQQYSPAQLLIQKLTAQK